MSESIDVRGLLTIDVASELRKLAEAQLQGPWQIPAEVVRRAIRAGATSVDVELGRHHARIFDDGAGLPGQALEWTAILLDEKRGNEDRHAALTALEATGELVLLSIAGLQPRLLRIESTTQGRRWVLEHHAGRPPWLQVEDAHAGRGCDLSLRSSQLDRRQCAEWLADAARFAPAAVRVDAELVSTGFGDTIASATLGPPLRGRVAIPTTGETAHAWLLEHGLITGHVAVPDAPAFEAAVELGGDANDLSAARLREAFQPLVPALVDRAVDLLAIVARRASECAEPVRARLARLVLQAARKRLRFDDMVRVPAFLAIENGAPRCIDLVSLRQSAQRDPSGIRILPALYPSQKPERFALGTTPVLIADEVERSRLAELMHVRFRPPDPRDPSHSLLAALRRGLDHVARSLGRAVELVRHPLRAPPVDDGLLAPAERSLVVALRGALGPTLHGVDMCEGKGPIRRTRGTAPRLLLPRAHPDVRAAVAAHTKDPTWLYPIAVSLLDDLPATAVRANWLEKA